MKILNAWRSVAVFSLCVSAAAVAAGAIDDVRLWTKWDGNAEFWMISNRSTSKPVRVTLRYSIICTQPATVTTETITVEPGAQRRLQRKNGYTGCGDKYLTISGAYYP